ncbi:MAG TPA: cytochrome c [Vicinamibacterales bacterium]|nr:cytochrome c [Vicinamibacterales bacterium]
MSRCARIVLIGLALLLLAAAGGVAYLRSQGFGARGARPSWIETAVARRLRDLATPRSVEAVRNPWPITTETIAAGRRHFADHCAICHANDGSGDTELGRGLYPPPPDLRRAATQELSDGELFAIIENGIRFTGMPGFGEGTAESSRETWYLVHFIRHLPRITPEELAEMEQLNPKTADEWREQQEAEAFLKGETTPRPPHPH